MVLKYSSTEARAAIFGSMVFVLIPYVASSPLVAQEIQYSRDVRPILAENCFACHGFDHAKREAGLRLDTADGATASLESGEVAIRPGSPDESEAIRRIFSADHDEMMPPSESGKTLSEQQKQILQTWVAQGARYDKHWSFIMPEKARLTNGSFRLRTRSISSSEYDCWLRDYRRHQKPIASPCCAASVLI